MNRDDVRRLLPDTTAVVAVQYREDGRLHATCRLWLPTEDRPVDTTDVMAYLRELDGRYALTETWDSGDEAKP